MKHFLITAMLITIGLSSFAQEKGKFRVGMDFGYGFLQRGSGGAGLAIEPKYNLKNNLSVGLRLEEASTTLVLDGPNATPEGTLSNSSSFVGTVEHYFNKGNSVFAPYVGAGLGVYILDYYVSPSAKEVYAGCKMGGLIRTGCEIGKFRIGVEYNIIPKSTYTGILSQIGSVTNNYLGVHIGFFLGGGQWNSKATAK